MNVIFIMNDTFRRDHLGCYGNAWIRTPHLNRLAQESAIFDRAYIASYPTVPNRWDLNTGRYGFPYRGWRPLDSTDVPLAEVLSRQGYATMLIHDTPMLSIDDYNYTRGYSAFRWVRGHHLDPFNTIRKESVRLPAPAHKLANPDRLQLYLLNSEGRRYDHEYMAGKSMSESIQWLQTNYNQKPFMLWIDMWDPHEPFDPPDYDWDRYRNPQYKGDRIIYPAYGRCTYMTEEEHENVRALYAGKVTHVDRWIGRLLETIESLGLLKNTLIIWTTDHGHLFGEHHLQGKPSGELGSLYEVTAHIPLLIRQPEGLGAGKRIDGLVQPPDIMPTILEFLGAPIPPVVQGKSVWPLITGQKTSLRKAAFSHRYSETLALRAGDAKAKTPTDIMFDGKAASRVTDAITVSTERWSYICAAADRPSELYDLATDPGQQQNVIQQHPDVARELRQSAVDFMKEHGAPPERLRPFVEGDGTPQLPLDTKLWGFKDNRGQWVTFPSEAVANLITGLDAPERGKALQKTTLGQVVDHNPKNLVRMWQYYWAQDLV